MGVVVPTEAGGVNVGGLGRLFICIGIEGAPGGAMDRGTVGTGP